MRGFYLVYLEGTSPQGIELHKPYLYTFSLLLVWPQSLTFKSLPTVIFSNLETDTAGTAWKMFIPKISTTKQIYGPAAYAWTRLRVPAER